MGFQFMDFRISMGLFPEIIEKILLFGISDLRFQARFQHLRPRFQLVADPSKLTNEFYSCLHLASNC